MTLTSWSFMQDIGVISNMVISDISLRQVVVSCDSGDVTTRVAHNLQWLRQVTFVHISATGGVADVMEIALRSSL